MRVKKHEYILLSDPLSLRERVGVRVKSTNTYPPQQAEGGGEGDWSGPDHDATSLRFSVPLTESGMASIVSASAELLIAPFPSAAAIRSASGRFADSSR